MDFYEDLRRRMIDAMQLSLKQIRLILNLGAQDLGDYVGLTRQSINNFENSKNKMSSVQYIAICSVFDHFVSKKPSLAPIIKEILNSNDTLYNNRVFEDVPDNSLVKKWFSCFPDSNINQPKENVLEDLVLNCKIFLDDTALCDMSDVGQISEMMTLMQKHSKQFVIPLKAVDSLQSRLLWDHDDLNLVRSGMKNLRLLQSAGIANIRGEASDVSIISTIVSVLIRYKMVYRLVVITQNKKLADAAMKLNNDDIGGFPIQVLYITPNKQLEKWENIQEPIVYDQELDQIPVKEDAQKEHPSEVNESPQKEDSLTGWEYI